MNLIRNRKAPAVIPLLDAMADSLQAYLADAGRTDAAVIGIRTGGVWVAEALRHRLGIEEPPGALNIAYHRDDFERVGVHPTVAPSDLPIAMNDRHVILVDDILYTGRTVRAALNEIFDFGRPASVALIVLVDRGGRELPVEATIIGKHMDLLPTEHVKLNGPEPLLLTVQSSA